MWTHTNFPIKLRVYYAEKSKFNCSILSIMRKKLTKQLLIKLLKNSKESDRKLAKEVEQNIEQACDLEEDSVILFIPKDPPGIRGVNVKIYDKSNGKISILEDHLFTKKLIEWLEESNNLIYSNL